MARQLIEFTQESASSIMSGSCRFEQNGICYSVSIQKRKGGCYHYLITKLNNKIYKVYMKNSDRRFSPYLAIEKAARDIERKIFAQSAY